ncbi:MAG: ribbon-helix-helix protein, CopG family [Polyangiaceae bacterium]|jgi:hypothetical protein
MTTAMHRLQVSLSEAQVDYLAERARRDGVSIAEIVRQLVEREKATDRSRRKADSLWSIAGIARERESLIQDTPVSERVDLYLAAAAVAPARSKRLR